MGHAVLMWVMIISQIILGHGHSNSNEQAYLKMSGIHPTCCKWMCTYLGLDVGQPKIGDGKPMAWWRQICDKFSFGEKCLNMQRLKMDKMSTCTKATLTNWIRNTTFTLHCFGQDWL